MYGKYYKALVDNGYSIIPIIPKSKRPAVSDWINRINIPPQGYETCGIGIVCGVGKYPVYAIDIDVSDAAVSKQFSAGFELVRTGMAPKALVLYRGTEGQRKTKSAVYEEGHIERLGEGQQFVAFGVHPVTGKPYSWGEKSPLNTPASQLPVADDRAINRVYAEYQETAELIGFTKKVDENNLSEEHEYDPTNPLDVKDPIGLSNAKLKKMVNALDPDCHRDLWRNIGMALHHETDGSPEGLELWDSWSRKGVKYKEGETEYFWDKFGYYTGEPLTVAYLIKQAKTQLENTLDEVMDQDTDTDENFFKKLDWSPSRFLNDPPGIPMVVEGMMPQGITGLFYSAGGAGKSTILLSLAARVSAANFYDDVTFLNRAVKPGVAVIITAEDPDLILNRRYIATIEQLSTEVGDNPTNTRTAVEKNLRILSTFGNNISLFKLDKLSGTLKTTRYYNQLAERLAELTDLSLILIDTKTRYSPSEGEGNVVATQEITFYEALALKTKASVILLHHSNKASRDGSQDGAQAYRDATAIFDSVRAAWYFRKATDKEIKKNKGLDLPKAKAFVLENSKNNYIQEDDMLYVVRNGYNYTATTLIKDEGKKETEDMMAERIQRVYNDILSHMQQSNNPDFILRDLKDCFSDPRDKSVVKAAIEELMEDQLLVRSENGRGGSWELTADGKLRDLQIKDQLESLL